MTNKAFYKKFNGVAGPEYRGAPEADFDPNAINEAEFHDDLRFKRWTSYLDEETQTLTIKWCSQCWPTCDVQQEIDRMTAEISRCMRCVGFTGKVVLELRSRDGDEFTMVFMV